MTKIPVSRVRRSISCLLMASRMRVEAYTRNREFGLDGAREGRLEFSPDILHQPILAGGQAGGCHDTKSGQSV